MVVVGHNDDNHPVACRGVADNEVAQETRVVAYVIEVEVVGLGIVAHGETYLVARVGLQGAVLDVENLVEELRNVEP